MLELIAFRPSHLADIDPPRLFREPMRRFALAYCESGPALTFVENSRVLGCSGLVIENGEARVWAFFSSLFRAQPQALHRDLKRSLPRVKRHYGLEHILPEVHPDHRPSRHWLEKLGFRFDGVGRRCPVSGERPLRYVY